VGDVEDVLGRDGGAAVLADDRVEADLKVVADGEALEVGPRLLGELRDVDRRSHEGHQTAARRTWNWSSMLAW
jgi:hypothetical protein